MPSHAAHSPGSHYVAASRDRSRTRARLIGPYLPAERRFERYGVAAAFVLVTASLRFALLPYLGTQVPLLPFTLAILATVCVAGAGPALLAAGLSVVAATLLFTDFPEGRHPLQWSAHLVLFGTVSALAIWVIHALQRATRAQEEALTAAEKAAHDAASARMAADEALRQAETSEAHLRLITDSMPVLMAHVDADYRFRFNNRAYEEWFGLERGEWIGRNVGEALGEDVFARLRPRMEAALSGERVSFEALIPDRDAPPRYIRAHYVPDEAPDGTVRGFFALIQDVTEIKRTEDALRDASRRKDEFLAMLAHELRNPLAPIRNVASLLSNDGLDPQTVRRSSELLQRQATTLSRLVDDLLDVARITRGSIELKRERVAIDAVIDQALEVMQPLLDVKRQTLDVRRAAAVLVVEGDAVRLSQMLTNVLSNASKYSPERSIIRVSVEDAGGRVAVHVRDEGMGIDPQLLPHIFDLFMQADRTLDRKEGGLGIGLTIVRHLAEMHGGSVQARSEGLGEGSEFTITLPIAATLPSTALPAGRRHPARAAIARRILVVEDNRDSAQSLAMLLRESGHEVQVADDGGAALQLLEGFQAEFILLDIGLPGMDGYLVAQNIRERFARRQHRLIALTGYGRQEDRALALDSGFDEHLTKPVDPAYLLEVFAAEGAGRAAPAGEGVH